MGVIGGIDYLTGSLGDFAEEPADTVRCEVNPDCDNLAYAEKIGLSESVAYPRDLTDIVSECAPGICGVARFCISKAALQGAV